MDIARLERAAGDRPAAGAELDAARVLLSELDAPAYRARVEELALAIETGQGESAARVA